MAFPVSEYSAFRAGIFQASRSTDPMWFLKSAEVTPSRSVPRLDEPTG
jgi:hypothetical protein